MAPQQQAHAAGKRRLEEGNQGRESRDTTAPAGTDASGHKRPRNDAPAANPGAAVPTTSNVPVSVPEVAITTRLNHLPFLPWPSGTDRPLLLHEGTRKLFVVAVFVVDFHTEAQPCTGREKA